MPRKKTGKKENNEYVEYDLSSMYEAVEWRKKGQEVEGIVTAIKKPDKAESQIMEIDTLDAKQIAVWESAGLRALFKPDIIGKQVKIRFEGMMKLKGKKQSMKVFKAWVKSQPDNIPF